MGFGMAEGRVLHGLLEDASGDIVIRLDAHGFILNASENACDIGLDLDAMLVEPHIADLAVPGHQAEVKHYTDAALSGDPINGWVHFPIRIGQCAQGDEADDCSCEQTPCLAWYALSLRSLDEANGAAGGAENKEPAFGALGLLRSVQHLHVLEDEIIASANVDPSTGLANRQAFCAALSRYFKAAEAGGGGENCLAVLSIDGLRAIYMQFGQRTADEVHWGFARFLEGMCSAGQELAHLDEERFAILLPDMTPFTAQRWADELVRTFASLTAPAAKLAPKLTASAGVARIEMSEDWSLRQAEIGLVMARAGGGGQVAFSGQKPPTWADGAGLEQAAQRAAQRALDELSNPLPAVHSGPNPGADPGSDWGENPPKGKAT